MKQSVPKSTFLLILLITAILGFLVFLKINSSKVPISNTPSTKNQDANVNTYTSKDLKISFKYQKNWYLDEKGRSVLITSYATNIGDNKLPSINQIKIDIDPIALCQQSIEENLIHGGCGENQKVTNKILNEENKLSPDINRYKFTLEFPDKSKKTLYYVEKNNKFIQISKTPDPSQFEKEFEDLVNSIRFTD